MVNNSPDDLLTRKQAADILEVVPQTVDIYRAEGRLPWLRHGMFGKGVRIRRGDVDALRDERDKVVPHE